MELLINESEACCCNYSLGSRRSEEEDSCSIVAGTFSLHFGAAGQVVRTSLYSN